MGIEGPGIFVSSIGPGGNHVITNGINGINPVM